MTQSTSEARAQISIHPAARATREGAGAAEQRRSSSSAESGPLASSREPARRQRSSFAPWSSLLQYAEAGYGGGERHMRDADASRVLYSEHGAARQPV